MTRVPVRVRHMPLAALLMWWWGCVVQALIVWMVGFMGRLPLLDFTAGGEEYEALIAGLAGG